MSKQISFNKKTIFLAAFFGVLIGVIGSSLIFKLASVETLRQQVLKPQEVSNLIFLESQSGNACSGFLVSNTQAVTAAHCFSETPESIPVENSHIVLAPYRLENHSFLAGPRCLVTSVNLPPEYNLTGKYKPEWDFALVTFEPCGPPVSSGEISLFSLGLFEDGSDLVTVGYPGDEKTYSAWKSEGKVLSRVVDFLRLNPKQVVETSLKSSKGTSGSVVYSKANPSVAVGVVILINNDDSTSVLTFDEQRLEMLKSWM